MARELRDKGVRATTESAPREPVAEILEGAREAAAVTPDVELIVVPDEGTLEAQIEPDAEAEAGPDESNGDVVGFWDEHEQPVPEVTE